MVVGGKLKGAGGMAHEGEGKSKEGKSEGERERVSGGDEGENKLG